MQMETVPAQVGLQGGGGRMRLRLHSEKTSWLVRNTFLSVFSKRMNVHRSKEQKGEKEKRTYPHFMKLFSLPAPGFTQDEPRVTGISARTGISGTSLSTILN